MGREAEIAALSALIAAPAIRILTLTGPGGVGKTRLARRLADLQSEHFSAGVWFIPLEQVVDPAQVMTAIGRALGLPELPERQTVSSIGRILGGLPALFVLDNFERVSDAAPQLLDLLASCPSLTILVTSRVVLHVRGEQEFPVAPLATPATSDTTPEDLARSPSVALFYERANSARSGSELGAESLETVAEICRRLDGLPLAIELAAARCRYLAPRALLARLDARLPLLSGGDRDLPARLQTMRDAIAWSYDLLTPAEQVLFRRLSIFAGGFTLETAEAVVEGQGFRPEGDKPEGLWGTALRAVGEGGRADETSSPSPPHGDSRVPLSPSSSVTVLDGLGSLLDKSLMSVAGPERGHDGDLAESRCRFLETIREFGLDELRATGEEDILRARHAAWFRSLTAEIAPRIFFGPLSAHDLDRLDADWENLRAALIWTSEHGQPAEWITFATDLTPYWYFRSRRRECLFWLERALALVRGPDGDRDLSPALRARVCLMAVWLMEERPEALAYAEESLAIARAHNDTEGVRVALQMLTIVLNHRGLYEQAMTIGLEALPMFEAAGFHVWAADCRYEIGLAAFELGDLVRAETMLAHAVAEHRRHDDPYGAGMAITGLGLLAVESQDFDRSASLFREAITTWVTLGTKEGLTEAIAGVAALARASGHPEAAARFFGAASGLAETIGYAHRLPERARFEADVAALQASLDDGTFTAATAAGRTAPLHDILLEATSFQPSSPSSRGGPAQTAQAPAGPAALASLTARELDVLRLLMEGLRDREIAARLGTSPKTAMRHVANIFAKLGVQSRTQAAHVAREAGLQPEGDGTP